MEAIENSIAFLTEDRKKEGLCLGLSMEKNVNLASYPMISRSGIINLKKERQRAEEYRHALAEAQRCNRIAQIVRPNAQVHAAYEPFYRRYQQVFQCNEILFQKGTKSI